GSPADGSDPIEQFSSEAPPAPPTSVAERPPSPVEFLEGDGGRLHGGRLRWAAAAAIVIAIGEATIIGRLYIKGQALPPPERAVLVEFVRPGADVLVDGQPAGVTPLALKIGPRTHSIRVVSHESDLPTAPAPAVAGEAAAVAAARPTGASRSPDNLPPAA